MSPRNTFVRSLRTVAIIVAMEGSALSARADPLEDLKTQIDRLQRQVYDVEQKQSAAEQKQAAVSDIAVTSGATKGSFKLPGSNTSVTLGGYVKLDTVFTNPSAGVNTPADLFLQPNAIPVGPGAGDNERNQVKIGARESRLFARTSTPTPLGDLVTYVEGDLYGADGNESVSNSNGPRLRHAYASLGHLLAGQTWTNFMYVPSLPETLDFGGPVGQIFARQAQIRWSQPFEASRFTGGGQWSVALENPESVIATLGGGSFRADDDRLPDLTGQLLFNTTRGKIAISGVIRQVRSDSRSPALVDQAWGGAASVAGIVPTTGKDDLRFVLTAGNAIGRYSDGFFPDGVANASGAIGLPRQWAWYTGYRHFWNDRLRSNIVLSSANERNPAGAPSSTNKSTQSAHANLIWNVVANTDVGLEYIYANRETEDGLKGHLQRLQASAKYAF